MSAIDDAIDGPASDDWWEVCPRCDGDYQWFNVDIRAAGREGKDGADSEGRGVEWMYGWVHRDWVMGDDGEQKGVAGLDTCAEEDMQWAVSKSASGEIGDKDW